MGYNNIIKFLLKMYLCFCQQLTVCPETLRLSPVFQRALGCDSPASVFAIFKWVQENQNLFNVVMSWSVLP